tara:strand:+ start:90 stop:902 length:813 start_codon:yes stop_codon:yes gene_type:complete
MKKNNKIISFSALLICFSCSDVSENAVNETQWDAINTTFYNEFMECTAGENFNEESVAEMIQSWRNLGLSEDLMGAWGYAPATDENSSPNGLWELQWTSKESADNAWAQFNDSEEANAWSNKYSNVMQCDGDNRDAFSFIFPYDPNAFGEPAENGYFASGFVPCILNDGKTRDDFTQALIAYNAWLDSIDESDVVGTYAYGVYFPEDPEDQIDFWWGNFDESFDTKKLANELWIENAEETKAVLDEAFTCEKPELFHSQVFYDPTRPNFS